MKNSRRFFAFAAVAFVLVSLIVSQPLAVAARKRCPVRIPDSLLTLYLKSDLIVVGAITGKKFLKKTHEYDHGYSFDVEKNLRVSKTLKGLENDSAAFVVSDYKSAKAEENVAENDRYAVGAGDEALFFLIENEDGGFELADYSSGMKLLSVTELGIYTKYIEQLKSIAATKNNQTAELTEWLVRLAEEPLTRDESTRDLNDSFYALESERENESGEITTAIQRRFVLDENFRAARTPEIAKTLTASQKQRLTTALLNSINDDLLKINGSENEEEIYPDYQSAALVGRWDKDYLAMSSFAFLLNADESNARRIEYLMRVISNFLEDEELYEILNEYDSALSESDDAEINYVEKTRVEEAEVSSEDEIATENEVVAVTDETAVESIEEVPTVENEQPETDAATEKSAVKITYKEYKKKLFDKFVKQYGNVIAQGSASN